MEGNPFNNFELDHFEINYTPDGCWHYLLARKNFLILIDQYKTRYSLHCYIDNEFHMSITGNFNRILDAVAKFLMDT